MGKKSRLKKIKKVAEANKVLASHLVTGAAAYEKQKRNMEETMVYQGKNNGKEEKREE